MGVDHFGGSQTEAEMGESREADLNSVVSRGTAMPRIHAALFTFLFLLGPDPAYGFEVFQDPNDTGSNSGTPVTIPVDGTAIPLNLYIQHDEVPSDPNVACSGDGLGDEYCGWDLQIMTTGDAVIESFDAEPGADVVSNPTAVELRANGGDPILGQVGIHRVGTLMVRAPGGSSGSVDVVGNLYVTAALTTSDVPTTTLALVGGICGEGQDPDGDGICDDGGPDPCTGGAMENCKDNCPFFPNPGQEDDGGFNTSVADGIGNACQCGDVDCNGRVNTTDGVFIKRSVAGLAPYFSVEGMPCPGNCDVDGNGLCNTTDGTFVKRNVADLPPPGIVTSQLCPNANP